MADPRLPNYQVATLALYLIGGASSRQDAEKVAVKCYELAPQRFCWRRYPQYPSEIRTRVALGDAKKAKNGSLVTGSSQSDWILTPAGIDWCQNHQASKQGGDSVSGSAKLTLGKQRDLMSLICHSQFERFRSGEAPPSQAAIADAVGLLPDAPAAAVSRKLENLMAAASSSDLEEVERFLTWLMTS